MADLEDWVEKESCMLVDSQKAVWASPPSKQKKYNKNGAKEEKKKERDKNLEYNKKDQRSQKLLLWKDEIN